MQSILILDDDDGMRDILAKTLTRAGYHVLQAPDGSDVPKMLKKEPIHLLITDLFMPETDGLETITNVRKQFPNVKIIAMSGGTRLTDRDYLPVATKLGAHRVLHKPMDAALFLKTVKEVLAAS